MPVDRLLPTEEAADIVAEVAGFARAELAPRAAKAEEVGEFPRELVAQLGEMGVFALPHEERWGGLEQPYEVYLQVLEEIAAAWFTVGVSVSVQGMTCLALATEGTEEQRERLLPDLIGGGLLGAYALSEVQAGSDVSAVRTRAVRDGDDYVLDGSKSWITHGDVADYYTLFARTSPGHRGVSAFLVPAGAEGISTGGRERKMGMTASPTTAVHLDGVRVAADRRIGAEGEGIRIALESLDSGRLGIAACATGLAQAALDTCVAYAEQREQFGRPVASFQGMQFLLADMATAVDTARATYLLAARKRDAGRPFSRDAAVAKLHCTDAAMKVTTDAVQVLGGYGYTRDFPLERYMREAKVAQIFEGTNQIQRLVVARHLLRRSSRPRQRSS
ncbi:acyl-CoA dehydrogenase [Desertihabitans brevis]|uniref:Acyl-CoA dehydrogenase n=1 Tax=Desertihabitans brevis TaxID=2268447 RepID=A0A367YXT7_9ACTN|nr:acyl-CoA dehydrogenase family protein [Desertihabitans brevis]RCK70650.1 acyl-CoA dehydrogenase [Desertihabitans brevis]